MNAKRKILFLCTHNAARSQIAEGFVNARCSDHYEAYSAKSLDEFDDVSFNYVITLCSEATESCPIFPGGKTYLQRAFPDPVQTPTEERENCDAFRHVRAQIKEWLAKTFGEEVA